jgi:hypothetical protein
MGEVVEFPNHVRVRATPKEAEAMACSEEWDEFFALGFIDGKFRYVTSCETRRDALWLIEAAKRKILAG